MTSDTNRRDEEQKLAELDTDQLEKVAGGLPRAGVPGGGPKKGGDPEDGGE